MHRAHSFEQRQEMLTPKRVLVSWYTGLPYLAPFKLSDRQLTVGPKVRPDQTLDPFDAFTPRGRFDLLGALQALKLPTDYDAIVVMTDPTGNNEPINLDRFDCPKILCVGDTHHLATPLRTMIDYANAARYDFIVMIYNRHHMHWFAEAGFKNVAWLPGLVPNVSRPFLTDRRPEMIFCGNSEKYHARRSHLLLELNSRKPVPLVHLKGPPEVCADRYASSAISLNCSLNGDLNLRVFEILSAGGCLLTDRLSEQAGLDLLLREGKEYIGYDSAEECIEQARFLLNHPDIAVSIARSGYELFNAQMRPEQRVMQLFDWIFQGRLDSFYRATLGSPNAGNVPLIDRIHLYENLQELQRSVLLPSVLFMDDVPDIHVSDALDLRQLRIAIADTEETTLGTKS